MEIDGRARHSTGRRGTLLGAVPKGWFSCDFDVFEAEDFRETPVARVGLSLEGG